MHIKGVVTQAGTDQDYGTCRVIVTVDHSQLAQFQRNLIYQECYISLDNSTSLDDELLAAAEKVTQARANAASDWAALTSAIQKLADVVERKKATLPAPGSKA